MGNGTVHNPAALSQAALLWKSQHSNISAELFHLCYLAGRQAPLLVFVTALNGCKTPKSTLDEHANFFYCTEQISLLMQ